MLKIKWTYAAIQDVEAILTYIGITKHNPIAAQKIANRLYNTVERLSENPKLGTIGRYPKTYEKVVVTTSYTLWYQFTTSDLKILRVMHHAKKWPETLPES